MGEQKTINVGPECYNVFQTLKNSFQKSLGHEEIEDEAILTFLMAEYLKDIEVEEGEVI